jgi:hypothetical protein
MLRKINLTEKFNQINETWSPKGPGVDLSHGVVRVSLFRPGL